MAFEIEHFDGEDTELNIIFKRNLSICLAIKNKNFIPISVFSSLQL